MPEPFFSEDFLRRLERLMLAARRAVPGTTQGERRSPRRGNSVEFADFRPYTAGDDIRRIDWNAYARLERFFIKLFVEEEDQTIHCLVDASPSMSWGQPDKLGYALRATGALGYIALSRLDRFSLTVLGRDPTGFISLPPQRGKHQAPLLFSSLQSLAAAPPPGAGQKFDPGHALQSYAGRTRQTGLLILLSDLMDDGWVEGLRTLAHRGFEITVVHILSPEEADPRIEGDYKLLDSESSAEVEVTADYQLLVRYHQQLAGWQEDLRRFCVARQIAYVPLITTLPLEDFLFAWLPRQGVLR